MNTSEAVLCMLREKTHISGEAIASKLKVSRNAVWKAMNTLRDMGYEIEGDAKGYRLIATPDLLVPYEVSHLLETKVMGRNMEHRSTLGSTNERARELAEKGSPEGTLVVSEVQEGGKGRIGREWVSPKGGIWMSLILRPDLRPGETPVLTLAGGVAVAEALASHDLEARLKWPNDVLLDERKVCGLLTEMRGEMERVHYIVMGFGINANFRLKDLPKDVRSRATTLLEVKGSPVDRKRLLADVLAAFEGIYNKGPKVIVDRWKALSSTLGRKVRIRTQKDTIEGLATGIDETGALVLELASGERRTIYSGDCEHLRNV